MPLWLLTLKTKNKGFTLIETMVVTTIFSFVLAGIAFSFMSGMRIWQRLRIAEFSRSNLLLTLEEISGALRQSADAPQIGFEGDASKVSFPVIKDNSVMQVIYEFDSNAKVLWKRYIPLQDVLAEKEGEDSSARELLSLEEFSLSYLFFDAQEKTCSWEDAWVKEDGIFVAIRLKARLKNEEFTKTIFIPIS